MLEPLESRGPLITLVKLQIRSRTGVCRDCAFVQDAAHANYSSKCEKHPRLILLVLKTGEQGMIGPFDPPRKATVPIWMACALKKRRKCRIVAPQWMAVGADVSRQVCSPEAEPASCRSSRGSPQGRSRPARFLRIALQISRNIATAAR